MSRMLRPLAMAVVLGCCGLAAAQEPQTIELRDGRYWESVKRPTTAPVTDEQLDRVGELIDRKNGAAAKNLALNWIKRNPKDHPLRDRALYLLGVANYMAGDRIEAFYDFDELLDGFPDSKYFYPALEKQYEIADAYLSGYKRTMFGLSIFSAEDEAIEMLYRIQERSPGSPLAEKSLKRTADYYYADAQYDLAVDAYQAFVERYRRSPDAPQAKLKRAFALLAQFRGTRFDPTPVINARTALEELQSEYPDLAKRENLAAVIERIDAALARKGVQIGDFYVKTHQPVAAAQLYRYVETSYPNTPEAQRARAALTRLPPGAAAAGVPATQPATRPISAPGIPGTSNGK